MRFPRLLALAAPALLLAPAAFCNVDTDSPASILIFPEFNSTAGFLTVFTVTNTSTTSPVSAHFHYIDADTCMDNDQYVELTANDTATVIAAVHNPSSSHGFLYVVAENAQHVPVSFNHLIGIAMVLQAFDHFDFSYNPFGYKAIATTDGTRTNVDGDSLLDLNGIEYDRSPNEIMIPSFFGQTTTRVSELVILNLTGASQWQCDVDFTVYDDKEDAFSMSTSFRCWTKHRLHDLVPGGTTLFDNDYLAMHSDAANTVPGAPGLETGWMKLHGALSFTPTGPSQIQNPSILAVLSERVGPYAMSDTPYLVYTGSPAGLNTGDLILQGILPDSTP